MRSSTRRTFLGDVGRGMLVAGIGTTLAGDLGIANAAADQGPNRVKLGEYEGLVDLLLSTPPEKLQPVLVAKLKSGECDLKKLVSAAALANAEAFGGQDYVGYHTAMAMLPAWEMTRLLPVERQPLPILKVLYRNSQQCQQHGGASKTTLQAIHAAEHAHDGDAAMQLRELTRAGDMEKAEKFFATVSHGKPIDAFNALQPAVQDEINVHRFVFAHRTYGLAGLLGDAHAHTLLRQCVRFCVDSEQDRVARNRPVSPIRELLPKLLDQYKLEGKTLGKRDPGDAAVDALAETIYFGPPAKSAEAVAGALAEGIDPEVVGEAISLASNMLTLRQGANVWRTHGDAAGVHSADATNAWRNMSRQTEQRHAVTGLMVAAYHSASHSPFKSNAYPLAEHRATVKASDAAGLLAEAATAITQNDQARVTAAIQIYGEKGFAVEDVFQLMLKFTLSEDGRLHGEKFFHTVGEEYRTTRPAFRWRQIVALARVTASAYGYDRQDKRGFHAPGYEEACRLLGVTA